MRKWPERTGSSDGDQHRRRRRRGIGGTAIVVAAVLLAASCGSSSKTDTSTDTTVGGSSTTLGQPVSGGTLRLLTAGEYPTLDPAKSGVQTTAGPANELYAVFGTLMHAAVPSGDIEMGIAESMTTSDSGTTWTLKLRPNVTFSDGTPFDASAVTFNWDRIKDPATASPSLRSVTEMASYDVVDPLTIKVVLVEKNSQFPRKIAGPMTYIASPTALTEKGTDFGRNPVGAGPFTLKEWVSNDHLTFVRNPTYWDAPRPYADELIIRPIADESGQRIRTFEAGQADVITLRDQIKNIDEAEDKGANVLRIPAAVGSGFMMNQRVPALGDKRVREAFGLTLNRPAILKTVYDETNPVLGMFRPDSPFYDPANDYPEPDLAKAQTLIDAYIAESGQDISLVYSGVTGVATTTKMAEVTKAQLEQLKGVHIEIALVDVATLVKDNNAGRAEIGAAAIQGVWPDPSLSDQFSSTGLQNTSANADPLTDAAFLAAHATESLDEQYTAYKEVAATMLANWAFVPLRHSVYALAAKPNVGNLQGFGDGGFLSDRAWIS